MHPLFAARTRAYLLDCLVYLGVPVAMVPIGLALRRRHEELDRRLMLLLSVVPPVAATLVAAGLDSGRGTPGHRAQGLQVLDVRAEVPSPGRSLLRNAVKVGAPWQLGHVVALGAANGGFERREPQTVAATVALYLWLALAVGAVATGSGRGLHDRFASTQVVGRPQ